MREHGSDAGKVKRYMPPGNAKKAGWRHFYVARASGKIAGGDDNKAESENQKVPTKCFTASGMPVTVNRKEDKK